MITIMQRARVVHDAYDSVADLRELELEAKVIAAQVPELERSVQRAQASLDDLRTAYAGGILTSPVDGTASEVRVQPGAVVRPGEPIMRIYHGESYVLAYVPTGTLYTVKPGDEVEVGVLDRPDDDATGHARGSGCRSCSHGRWRANWRPVISSTSMAKGSTASMTRGVYGCVMRFDSRVQDRFAHQVIAALRNQFGGHAVKAVEAQEAEKPA